MQRSRPAPTRREALSHLAAATAAVTLPAWPLRPSGPARHVLVVVHVHGARTADTLDAADATPALERIAALGVRYLACQAGGTTPESASRALVTGVDDVDPDPGSQPTLAEYVQADAGSTRHDAWVVCEGRGWIEDLGSSKHTEYGARRAARLLRPSSVLPPELAALARERGAGRVLDARDDAALEDLRAAVLKPPDPDSPPPEIATALDRFVAGEIGRNQASAPGSSDARVLRAATALLAHGRPRLVLAVLEETAVADVSFERYREVLAATDTALGAAWDAIAARPALAATTALLVLPALGRNKKVTDGTLGQDDGSLSVKRSWLVAAGAGVQRGVVVKSSVAAAGVCASAARLLGIETPRAKARVIKELISR